MWEPHLHRREFITQNSTSNVTINEHRAATDESVRLLADFQKTTLENIFVNEVLENNLLDDVRLMIYKDPFKLNLSFVLRFVINNKKHIVKAEVDTFKIDIKNKYELLSKAREVLALELSKILMLQRTPEPIDFDSLF